MTGGIFHVPEETRVTMIADPRVKIIRVSREGTKTAAVVLWLLSVTISLILVAAIFAGVSYEVRMTALLAVAGSLLGNLAAALWTWARR